MTTNCHGYSGSGGNREGSYTLEGAIPLQTLVPGSINAGIHSQPPELVTDWAFHACCSLMCWVQNRQYSWTKCLRNMHSIIKKWYIFNRIKLLFQLVIWPQTLFNIRLRHTKSILDGITYRQYFWSKKEPMPVPDQSVARQVARSMLNIFTPSITNSTIFFLDFSNTMHHHWP